MNLIFYFIYLWGWGGNDHLLSHCPRQQFQDIKFSLQSYKLFPTFAQLPASLRKLKALGKFHKQKSHTYPHTSIYTYIHCLSSHHLGTMCPHNFSIFVLHQFFIHYSIIHLSIQTQFQFLFKTFSGEAPG